MCTDVWVPVVASPCVEMLRQMSSEATTPRKVGLANEDDRHTWGVAALPALKVPDEISKARSHEEADGDREIEAGARLAHAKVDRDPSERPRWAAREDGGAFAIACLPDGCVGRPTQW
jgi:hypothetical protein